jgi:hypothetical protein
MNIEWEMRITDAHTLSHVARILAPSNLRQITNLGRPRSERHAPRSITAALYQKCEDGRYQVAFIPAIQKHFDIPKTLLNTERGARRRIRKYVELWAIAGYPRAFGGER